MTRSNTGNQITNATQILSVGAVTASGVLKGMANKSLNAKSAKMEQAKLDNINADTGLKIQRTKQLENMNAPQPQTVDELMSDTINSLKSNSEQIEDVKLKSNNDIGFIKDWKASNPANEDVFKKLINKGGE
jgi:hypothetical protein